MNILKHYMHGSLLEEIQSALAQIGKRPQTVTIDDLAAVDEFHIGGRYASKNLLNQIGISPKDHILDIGCGLGGTARFIAGYYKCRVSGIDLSSEYINTGNTLCKWVGLSDRVQLYTGSGLSIPFGDESFDGACMLHVGMNIDNKLDLFKELARVMRKHASLGIYDVMRVGGGALTYPVPWASHATQSVVTSPSSYRKALLKAGFVIKSERNQTDFATKIFEQIRIKNEKRNTQPPLGLHIVMGNNAHTKISNMMKDVYAGSIAPIELIAQKK